jgi:ABC-type dipeptide/oligopeptide/nickel transport system permease component
LLLPVTQFFSTRAILLLGTVVIIETIMNINGVGWLLWQAAEMRDTPVVLAIALFATVLASLLQMLNEIALKLIDPRLRR